MRKSCVNNKARLCTARLQILDEVIRDNEEVHRASVEYEEEKVSLPLTLRIEQVESAPVDRPTTSTVSALEQDMTRINIKQEPADLLPFYEL